MLQNIIPDNETESDKTGSIPEHIVLGLHKTSEEDSEQSSSEASDSDRQPKTERETGEHTQPGCPSTQAAQEDNDGLVISEHTEDATGMTMVVPVAGPLKRSVPK